MEKAKYDWLIVGAGLFGSVFAHEMTKAGKKCLVIDKRNKVGGNCSCRFENGLYLHEYGAHIVHTAKKSVWDYIDALMPLRRYEHNVMANNGGSIYTLPFCLHTFRELYAVTSPNEARAAIKADSLQVRDNDTVETLALSSVGRLIYETLIRGYTEKQWGCRCDELPAFILGRIPLRFNYKTSYYNEEFVGLPADGDYNTLFYRLLDNCDVRLNTSFERQMLSLAEKTLYTGGIDAYFDYKLGKLGYRSLEFIWKKGETSQGCAVMNFTGKDVPFTRSIEHNFFMPQGAQSGAVIQSIEYPRPYDGRNEPIYPINTEKNNALYHSYAELAKREKNVVFGGRLGSYSYYSMGSCIEAALELAKRHK